MQISVSFTPDFFFPPPECVIQANSVQGLNSWSPSQTFSLIRKGKIHYVNNWFQNAKEQAMHFFRVVCLSHFLETLQTAIKWNVEDTQGHIFTDQTVVFYMETTCGQSDDQREFAIYMPPPSCFPVTVYICLFKTGAESQQVHVIYFRIQLVQWYTFMCRGKKITHRLKKGKQTGEGNREFK